CPAFLILMILLLGKYFSIPGLSLSWMYRELAPATNKVGWSKLLPDSMGWLTFSIWAVMTGKLIFQINVPSSFLPRLLSRNCRVPISFSYSDKMSADFFRDFH